MSVFTSSGKVKQMELSTGQSRRSNNPVNILSRWICQDDGDDRDVLVLNVLLLGNRQSGRSSVGNALIGGHGFQTGTRIFDESVTKECQALSRNYPRFFRRRGAECDLVLRVIDTPTILPHPQNVHKLCPEGVHVAVFIVRADLPHASVHLEQHAESLFGPEWRHHTLLVLTYADQLKKAGLTTSGYLKQTTEWLQALAQQVTGGVLFMDNSCEWPVVRGEPLRDRLLHLSARNHHRALKVRTEVSL